MKVFQWHYDVIDKYCRWNTKPLGKIILCRDLLEQGSWVLLSFESDLPTSLILHGVHNFFLHYRFLSRTKLKEDIKHRSLISSKDVWMSNARNTTLEYIIRFLVSARTKINLSSRINLQVIDIIVFLAAKYRLVAVELVFGIRITAAQWNLKAIIEQRECLTKLITKFPCKRLYFT